MTSTVAIAQSVITKITGGISFFCSSYIFLHIIRDKKRRSETYHRILCGMSISDMLFSFECFLSTWPFPAGETWGAIGSMLSCDIVGFITQFGCVCYLLYCGSLATYFVLKIRFNWQNPKIKKIEWLLHIFPIVAAGSMAISGWFLKLYSSANWICWIAPYPDDCDSQETCIRGWNSNFYRLAFMYGWVWTILLYVSISMFAIFRHASDVEKQSDEFRRGHKKKMSESVRFKALLYVGSLFSTWIFGSITRLLQMITGKVYTPLLFLLVIFFPLSGFFNFLIYFRPRYLEQREANEDKKFFFIVKDMFSTINKDDTQENKQTNEGRSFNNQVSKSSGI